MIDLLTDLALMGLRPVSRSGDASRERGFEGLLDASAETLESALPSPDVPAPTVEAVPAPGVREGTEEGDPDVGIPNPEALPRANVWSQTDALRADLPQATVEERFADAGRPPDDLQSFPPGATPPAASPDTTFGHPLTSRTGDQTTEGPGHLDGPRLEGARSPAMPVAADPLSGTVASRNRAERPVPHETIAAVGLAAAETAAEPAIGRPGAPAPIPIGGIANRRPPAEPFEPPQATAQRRSMPDAFAGTAVERALDDAVVRVVAPTPRLLAEPSLRNPADGAGPIRDGIAFDPTPASQSDAPVLDAVLEPLNAAPPRSEPVARPALESTVRPAGPPRPMLAEARELVRPAVSVEPSAVRLESTGPLRADASPIADRPQPTPMPKPDLRVVVRPSEWDPDLGRLQGADVNVPTLQSELYRLPTQAESAPRSSPLLDTAVDRPLSVERAPAAPLRLATSRPASPARSRPNAAPRADVSPELRLVGEPTRVESAPDRIEGAPTGDAPVRPDAPGPQMPVRRVRVELDPSMAVEVSVRADGVDVAVDGTREALEQLDALEPELRAALDEGVEALEPGRGRDLGDAWGESDRRERSQLLSYEQIEREDTPGFEAHADLAGGFEDADDGAGDGTADGAEAERREDRAEAPGRVARSYSAARDWRGTRIDRIA
jgi:hypothetical protein